MNHEVNAISSLVGAISFSNLGFNIKRRFCRCSCHRSFPNFQSLTLSPSCQQVRFTKPDIIRGGPTHKKRKKKNLTPGRRVWGGCGEWWLERWQVVDHGCWWSDQSPSRWISTLHGLVNPQPTITLHLVSDFCQTQTHKYKYTNTQIQTHKHIITCLYMYQYTSLSLCSKCTLEFFSSANTNTHTHTHTNTSRKVRWVGLKFSFLSIYLYSLWIAMKERILMKLQWMWGDYGREESGNLGLSVLTPPWWWQWSS